MEHKRSSAPSPTNGARGIAGVGAPLPLPPATSVTASPVATGVTAAGSRSSSPRVRDSRPAPDRTRAGTSASGSTPPATTIDQYELIRRIGRGGMGSVYLARDTRLGRRVAVKLLRSNKPDLTARFVLEARATASCNHENIVVIHDVGVHGGRPFMVLEYLSGESLEAELERMGRLPCGRAVEQIVPVVRALACAHARSIVHRDLKPDNIFITDTGTVKVLDFGIAKLVHADTAALLSRVRKSYARTNLQGAPGPDETFAPSAPDSSGVMSNDSGNHRLTQHGMLIGTLPYMSPEQWRAEDVDHRTDIWAVGIILFRMVTGQHPLAPLAGGQLMVTGILDEPMPGVREVCPEVPDELADIIDRCLVKPRERRIGSADELLELLERLLPGRRSRVLTADQSPYAGLVCFQETDADRFFGRAEDIAAVMARMRTRPLIGVVGPSGVGKSSFVRAGLIPSLKDSGEPWTGLVIRPGRDPIEALAHVIAPMLRRSSNTLAGDMSDHRALVERLRAEPGYFGSVLRARARRRGERILVFADQLEELYTLNADASTRAAFIACLSSAADDPTAPIRAVLSIRSDFLDRLSEAPRFMADLAPGLYFLCAPGPDGLREAIARPAEMAGHAFESSEIIDDMLGHLASTPGALPLLQFAASKLWELRDRDRKLLTVDSYQAIGGVEGALASHADAVMSKLSPADHPLVRQLFLRLVTPERTRAVVPMAELLELRRARSDRGPRGEAVVESLIDRLVQARLLVVQAAGQGGAGHVEIVHESLIHSWPALTRWLDDSQDDAAFLSELRTDARKWRAKGRPDVLLWRGDQVAEARRFVNRYRGELTAIEREFLAEVFRLDARSSRRKRVALVAAFALLSALLAAAAVALWLVTDARERESAEALAAETARDQAELRRVEAEAAKEEAERSLQLQRSAIERETQARAEADEAKELAEEQLVAREDELRRRKRAERKARKALENARAAKEQSDLNAEQARKKREEALRILEVYRQRLGLTRIKVIRDDHIPYEQLSDASRQQADQEQ